MKGLEFIFDIPKFMRAAELLKETDQDIAKLTSKYMVIFATLKDCEASKTDQELTKEIEEAQNNLFAMFMALMKTNRELRKGIECAIDPTKEDQDA